MILMEYKMTTTFNTGNPVGSTASKDLSDNASNFDDASLLISDTWQDRLGVTRDTVNGRIKKMGFAVPIAYAGAISFTASDNVKTVEEAGIVYAPLPSALPFTTTGTFVGGDDAKFFVVQGVTNNEVINDLSQAYTFKTVALMKASAVVFPAGKKIFWQGYYAESDGGSNWGIVKSGTHTDDGGSVFTLADGKYVKANLQGSKVSVLKFGAKGNDPLFDDAPYMNTLNAYIQSTGYQYTGAQLGSSHSTGARQEMGFATRTFYLGETVELSSYDNTDFENAMFFPHSTFDIANDYAFSITPYNCKLRRIKIAKFDKGIKLFNNNLDGTVVRISEIQASGMKELFDITLRSALVVIDEYKFGLVSHIAVVHDCDKLHVKSGWVNAGQLSADYDAHFILDSITSISMHVDDMFYVPRAQSFNNCAIVNLGTPINDRAGRVYFNNLLAGAEDGRIALVNNYARADVGRGTYINIGNGSGNPVVRLLQLPNAVSFTNQSGGIDETHTDSMVAWDSAIRTFAAAEAGMIAGTHSEIWFNGYTPRNFENLPRANLPVLNKLVVSKNKTFRAYEQGVTTTPQNVVIPNAVRFSRGKVWKIKATNLGNPGADRYTEVIVSGDVSGTTLTFIVIVQGTLVAPIFVQSAGVLQVKSTSGTNDFGIEIEQLVDATESFL